MPHLQHIHLHRAIPPPGDAPCPNCGRLFWFCETSAGMRFYESKAVAPIRDKILQTICENLRVNKEQVSPTNSFLEDVGVDSLDIAELMMELDEEFDVTIPDEDTEKIKTVGNVHVDETAVHGSP